MRSTPGARTATTASSPRATTTARRSRTRGTGCAATAAACAHPDTRVMSKRWESCFPHLREPLLYMRLRLRWRPRRKRGRVPVPPGSAPRQLRHLQAELVDRTARRVDRTGRRMSAENHKRRAETNLGSSRSQLGSLPQQRRRWEPKSWSRTQLRSRLGIDAARPLGCVRRSGRRSCWKSETTATVGIP
jgi:hypothetical protein